METGPFMLRFALWLTAALVFALGCSAPHDNPLDPDSPRYREPIAPPALEARVHSLHISRTFPTGEIYQVEMQLVGTDAPEQDSVRVIYDERDTLHLEYLADSSFWVANVTATTLGDPDLGAVVGKPFAFLAWSSGTRFEVGPAYLFRVIEDVPLTVSPSADSVTGPHPTLTWQPFSAAFPFGYRAQVFPSQTNSPIWSTPIPSGVFSIQVTDSLADGDYYWTITVIDEFGDYSRSREAYFAVVAESGQP